MSSHAAVSSTTTAASTTTVNGGGDDAPLSARDRRFLRRARRALWLLVVALHLGYAVAYGFEARYYVDTITSPLYFTMLLRVFGRKQQLRDEVCVAVLVTSAAFSVWHFVAGVRMIRTSFTHKRLLFRPEVSALYNPSTSTAQVLPKQSRSLLLALILRPWRWTTRMWALYCGVDGLYFELVTDLRESFEIATQTYVVYRLSCFVAHPRINRLATLLLVANCWSTPMLRTWFAKSTRGPLIRTIVGMLLASMFTGVVPFIVFARYYELAQLPVATRYDPYFFINRGNLFQQIFTLTWKDWCATRMAALFAIASLETVKRKANERAVSRRKKSRKWIKALTRRIMAASVVVPTTTATAMATPSSIRPDSSLSLRSQSLVFTSARLVKRMATSHMSHRFADVLFFGVGLTVLVLYIVASSHAPPSFEKSQGIDCSLLLRPWLASTSVCAVLNFNCHRLTIQGRQHEWNAVFAEHSIDNTMLQNLMGVRFSHCPQLDVPTQVKRMHSVIQIVVFNATIATWDENAALTLRDHPNLSCVVLMRVRNLHHLPRGLVANDFPAIVFEISDSDLVDLPPDLAQLWPLQIEQLNLERSQLTKVPSALLDMRIGRLSLAGNQIQELPAAFLTNRDFYRSLLLTDNPLASLPDKNVVNFKTHHLGLVGTQIESLPAYVEQAAAHKATLSPFVMAANTPLCRDGNHHSYSSRLVQCTLPQATTLMYYITLDAITAANPP